jgi:O-antigen/teichoic acid export membrane protein
VKPSVPLATRGRRLLTTAQNAGWLAGSRLSGDVLNFLLFVVLSRRFGPAGVGAYAYAFSIAGFGYAAASLGLEEYGVREMARRPPEAGGPLLQGLFATQLWAIALVVLGLGGFLLLSRASLETAALVLLLSVSQLGVAMGRTLFVPAMARQEMAAPAMAELLGRAAAVLTALLLLVVVGSSLAVSLIGYPIAGLAFVVVAAISAKGRVGSLHPRLSRGLVPATVRGAWPFAATDVLFQLFVRTDVILLTLMLGEVAAGLYATALKFVEVGVMPVGFLGVAGLPALSRLFETEPDEFAAAADDLLKVTLVVGGLVSWGLLFVAPVAIVPLLGQRFEPTTQVVRVMAALALLRAAGTTTVRVLLATHLQLTRLRVFAFATALNVGLNLVLIPLAGVPGAVAASIVSLFALDAMYLLALRGTTAYAVLRKTSLRFLLPVVAGLASGLVSERLSSSPWPAALVSLVVYLAAAIGTGFVPVPGARRARALPGSS